MNAIRRLLCWGLPVLALSAAARAAEPVNPSFTYQGKLTQNGQPVTVNCDFKFRIFDAEVAGNEIGAEFNVWNVALAEDGTFTVDLFNVGAFVFLGDERWLEVDVRSPAGNPEDPAGYTMLSPRQPILPTPYALYALSAASPWTEQAGQVLTSDNVGIGTKPAQRLHIAGDAVDTPTIVLQSQIAPANEQAAALRVDTTTGDLMLGRMSDDGSSVSRSDLIIDATTGNVGIGIGPGSLYRLSVVNPSSADTTGAILGQSTASSGFTNAGSFQNSSPQGTGVSGNAVSVSGANVGVRGLRASKRT